MVQLELGCSSDLEVLWRLEDLEVWYVRRFFMYHFLRFASKHFSSNLTENSFSVQVLGYIIIGSMLLVTVQALGELAVLFPVNGAFFTYVVRFVDPSLYV